MRAAFIDVKGVRTRYLYEGTGDPLLLVHGSGSIADNFYKNIDALGTEYTVYAPDVIGISDWHVPELDDRPFGARHHAHWLDIVRGAVPDDASAWDALAGLHVIEAIYEAAESGGRVRVSYFEKAGYDR